MQQHIIDVGTRRQVFIDGRFLAQSDGMALQVHPPVLRGPVLRGDRPWEAGWMHYACLIQDGDVLKLWYGCHPPSAHGQLGPEYFCYATSHDGVHWERPNLGLVAYNGSSDNNIIAASLASGSAVFVDEKASAEMRYKMLRMKDATDLAYGGVYLSYSSDGLHWTEHPQRLLPFAPDTQNQVLYDPAIGRYVAYLRCWAPMRKVARVEIDDLLRPWPYDTSVQPNRLWGEHYLPPPGDEFPQAISYDEFDPPETDIYTPAVSLYPWAEHVYVAFPSLYSHFPEPPGGQYPNDGLVDVQLAVSRDGRRFERPDRSRAYIPLGIYGGPEGGSIYMAPGLARRGDEIYHYYVAYGHSHGEYVGFEHLEGIGGIYLAVQRLDGFMSASADYEGGWLVTPLLTHAGRRLELNIDCGATGYATVELRDEHDVPIAGFSAQECDRIQGNHIHHTVSWKGKRDVSVLVGKPVRLRLVMRKSLLFAFQFCDADHDGS